MKVATRALGWFGVRPDEAERVGFLLAYSMFIGVFCSFYLTVANALFLDRFDITVLPLGYLMSAIVGYSLIQVFSRVEKVLPFSRLVLVNLGFLFLLATTFYVLLKVTDNDWIVFVAWSSLGAMFSLTFLGYWKLAARLFDLRQGKRLFALVGAGEEVSTVIGLFSIPVLLRYLDSARPLLLVAAAGLLGSLAIVSVVVVRYRDLLGGAKDPRAAAARKPTGFSHLLKNNYFLVMAGLAVLLTLAEYIVDFSFLSQMKLKFTDAAQIAQFLGVFFGGVKILELLMKVFVGGRLLNQFGLKVGLLILPGLLAICAALAIVIGAMGTAVTHFFVLVALSKLVWVTSRTSTFLPSFRVLYQPVPAGERQSFETHVSGTTIQLSIGAVGLALMLFSRSPYFNASTLYYVLVPVLAAWLTLVLIIHKQYRIRLLANLEEQKGQVSTVSPVEALVDSLRHVPSDQIENAVAVLARVDATAAVPMLERIITSGVEDGQVQALRYVGKLKAVGAVETVRRAAAGDPSTVVRAAAVKVAATLQEVVALSRDPVNVKTLAVSEQPADRDLAVSAIGFAAQPDAHVPLTDLLWDKDQDVRRAALIAAGRTGNPAYWHRLVSQLFSPSHANAATFAVITIGDPIIPELERAFSRADTRLKSRILRIYERIGSERARGLLMAKLSFPDREVRQQALLAINRCGHRVDEKDAALVVNEIERVVGGMVWNMAAVLDLTAAGDAMTELRQALELEIQQGRRSLFLLLELLYDAQAVKLVRENLESAAPGAVVYALEILEILIAPELKPVVFPVLEDVNYPVVLKRLDELFPRHRLSQAERLSAIANRGYDQVGVWTRACALRAIADTAEGVEPDLIAALAHPARIIREVAAVAIHGKAPDVLSRHLAKLGDELREALAALVVGSDEQAQVMTVYERVQVYRAMPVLAELALEALVVLAEGSEQRILRVEQRIPLARDSGLVVYVVLAGAIDQVDRVTGQRRAVGFLPRLVVFGPVFDSLEATAPTRLLRIDAAVMSEVAAEHAELLPKLLLIGRQQPDGAEGRGEAGPADGTWPEAHGLGVPV